MTGLLEILTNKFWMIAPDNLHAMRKVIEQNLNSHAPLGQIDKTCTYLVGEGNAFLSEAVVRGENAAKRIKEPFANVIVVDGPVTRNGGACSYGSKDHRDMIFAAANNPKCVGHIFYINTPGGSAWSINDYKQAIDYARSKGQPVYAFIDGMCASAGMYLAAMCDARYYMNPNDEVGCIGTLCAFYSEKDGEKNQYTNETYHEIYDPESFDKNKWYRDLAQDSSDTKALVEELRKLGKQFRDDVKTHCPNATEEHLHGKIFNAESVKGVLVDEQMGFGEVVALCFEKSKKNSNPNNDQTMSNKYKLLALACGVSELVVTEEGTHLDVSLLDALEESLAAANATIDELQKSVAKSEADCKAQIDEQSAKHQEEAEQQSAKHQEEIDAMVAKHQSEIDELNAKSNDAISQLQKDLDGAKAALETASQLIADRDAQIKALTESPAETPDESPENNGMGVEFAIDSIPAYDSNLSPMENQRIRDQWKAEKGLD